MSARGGTPRASAWPCPRYVQVTQSSGPDRRADPHAHGLVAGREVYRARDRGCELEPAHLLLETAASTSCSNDAVRDATSVPVMARMVASFTGQQVI